MIYIVLKNNNILNISETLDNLYYNLLTYVQIIIDCSIDKLIYINELKITEYNNNCPSNSYKLSITTLNLIDNNNNIININNNQLEEIRKDLLIKINKTSLNEESEINVFLPMISSDNINESIYIKSNNKTKEDDIQKLKEKIDNERQNLEIKNSNYDRLLNSYLENKQKIGLIESKLKIKEERKEEKKRIFQADLQIYNSLINEIEENSRELFDIPELFKNKFVIFNELHSTYVDYNNLEDQYEKYIDMTNKLKLTNIQFKTNYDDLFDNNTINDLESDIEISDSDFED